MSHLGERLSAFIDGELSHAQRERVLAHLARCEPCRSEAAALRTLKRRMHALGEHAPAAAPLTDRLIAMAGPQLPGEGVPARRPWAAGARSRWPARSLVVAGLVLGLGVPSAVFLAGGGQQEPGPSVTPAVDMFMVQHAITTGEVPAEEPAASPSPARPPAPPAAGQAKVPARSRPGVIVSRGRAQPSVRPGGGSPSPRAPLPSHPGRVPRSRASAKAR
jgi:anti-sigma factor RsiW